MRRHRNPIRRLVELLITKPGTDDTSKRVSAKLDELEREVARTKEIVDLHDSKIRQVEENAERIKKIEDAVLAGGGGA